MRGRKLGTKNRHVFGVHVKPIHYSKDAMNRKTVFSCGVKYNETKFYTSTPSQITCTKCRLACQGYGDYLQSLTIAAKPDLAKALEVAIKMNKNEKYEVLLLDQIKKCGLPTPTRQYKFHPDRKYRADLCYIPMKWIIEIDGGVWMGRGGHTTGTGYERDRIRDAEAQCLNFKVTRFTTGQVESGEAIHYIEKLFKGFKDESENKSVPNL